MEAHSSRFKSFWTSWKQLPNILKDLDPHFKREKREKATYAKAVVRNMKICENATAAYGFKYNSKGLSKRKTKSERFRHILTLFGVSIQGLLYFKWLVQNRGSSSNDPNMALWKIVMFYFFDVYTFFPIVGWAQSARTNDVMSLTWYPFEMETFCWNAFNGKPNHLKSLVILVNDVLLSSMIFTGILFPVLTLILPCFPSLLAYHLNPECTNWNTPYTGNRIALVPIALWEGHNWFTLWSIVNVSLASGMFYPSEIVVLWLRTIKRKMRWATSPELNRSYLLMYRHAQILFNRCNAVWAHPSLYSYFAAYIFAFITTSFGVTRLHSTLPPIVTAFFTNISVNVALCIHFVFYLLSQPYISSTQFLKTARESGHRHSKTSKYSKVFLKSCSPIQLSFGGRNFFDRLTAVNMWQFCIDRLIGLLLMSRGDSSRLNYSEL